MSEEKEGFMGRSGKSWGQILGFYLIYYTCLFGFWFAVWTIFTSITFEENKPTWVGDQSRIGAFPGIVVKPSQDNLHRESLLYRLNLDYAAKAGEVYPEMGSLTDKGNKGYAARLAEIVTKLDSSGRGKNSLTEMTDKSPCHGSDDKKLKKLKDGQWCHFDPHVYLGPCSSFPFGYTYHYNLLDSVKEGDDLNTDKFNMTSKTISPCFFIKVNRMFKTNMEPVKSNKDMKHFPKELKQKLKGKSKGDLNKMFIHCEGTYPPDKALLEGKTLQPRIAKDGKLKAEIVPKMEFFPRDQGIPMKFFPMRSKENRENGYVAIKLNNLDVGHLIHIKCESFFKDSQSTESGKAREEHEKLGTATFNVLVNDDRDFMFA